MWKPIIAAINGHALGIGLTLAVACDFRIAADHATFGYPEVKLGMPTIMGAIRTLSVIGMDRALDLLLTGERIDAQRRSPGDSCARSCRWTSSTTGRG
ncbi:MAG: enoyl-CoA hydratase/isomerase family protein [Dehalococcoidia bacterium]